MVEVSTPAAARIKEGVECQVSGTDCKLEHIIFHPMPYLTSFSCHGSVAELGVIIHGIIAMGCERLKSLTLMIVNRDLTGRKALAKERHCWRALESTLVTFPDFVDLSVLYLYGVHRSAAWRETRYGGFDEYRDREEKVFRSHGKAIKRWLTRVGQRSTISRCIMTVPWGERYAVSAIAGDIQRMFGPYA